MEPEVEKEIPANQIENLDSNETSLSESLSEQIPQEEESSLEESPLEESSVEESPMEEEQPVEETSQEESPMEEEQPVEQESPLEEETSPEETSPEETSVEETSPEETSVEESSQEESSQQETSPEETSPEEETLEEETSPEESPLEEVTPEEETDKESNVESSDSEVDDDSNISSDLESDSESDSDEDKEEEVLQDEDVEKLYNKNIKNTELYNTFKDDINNIDFTKDLIDNNKNNISTKKDLQYFLNAIELLNNKTIIENKDANYFENYDNLYPHLDDELLNIKLSNRVEFKEHSYNLDLSKDTNFEEKANEMCNQDFELAPHQNFVRNFLSSYTPYNGLLLFHGLGTGKTCSAINIAEETREYLKFNNKNERIIVVCSPKVEENFKLQLFDERKLHLENDKWVIDNCAGNNLLKDINSLSNRVSREKVIKFVENLIRTSYLFLGYVEFSNLIIKKSSLGDNTYSAKQKKQLIKNKLQKFFGNRLVIIDEIHNIRDVLKDSKKIVSKQMHTLVSNVENMKLVLMSATPMYNEYKEIIYLINLLNLNDKRSTIEISDVFDAEGNFLTNDDGIDVGKRLLKRKMNGYISYVKGDNPFTFPYRILPELFDIERSSKNLINSNTYPSLDINGNNLEKKIKFFDLYLNEINPYQEAIYKQFIKKYEFYKYNNDSYKYTLLQKPLESLNIVYPINDLQVDDLQEDNIESLNIDLEKFVGKSGINNLMSYEESKEPPCRFNYNFKDSKMENVFLKENIGKYSCKIKSILDCIHQSSGPIIIYSQFIDGGIIPMALALEASGFMRYGDVKPLFSNSISNNIDKLDLRTYNQVPKKTAQANIAKYIMITGDKILSPNFEADIKACTDSNNINGNIVKVILISMAGSEGLDFKFIRQVHIMEPWYNINRAEQIIGRGVRTCSHKDLPLKERNVKIYMHATSLEDKNVETIDMLVYRKAEEKAIKIGNVTRLMKEVSTDCYLNNSLQNLSREDLKKINENGINIELSNQETIQYFVGDQPYSALCDYMEDCKYKCNNSDLYEDIEANNENYNESFLQINNAKIIKSIKKLFLERFFYTKLEIISELSINNKFSYLAVNNALDELVNNPNQKIIDKYNRRGKLINIDDMYIYQPSELNFDNVSLYENFNPIHKNVDALTFKVQDEIKQPVGTKKYKITKKKQDTDNNGEKEDDIYTARDKNNSKVFDFVCDSYINIINGNKDFKNSFVNKYDKFKGLTDIFERKIDLLIPKEYIRKIIITIILESLSFNSHKDLIEFIYLKDDELLYTKEYEKEVFIEIQEYYKNLMLENERYKVFAFSQDIFDKNDTSIDKKYNYRLYILNTRNQLEKALPLDYDDFNSLIENKYKIPSEKLDNILGFIDYENKVEGYEYRYSYMFKLKDFTNKQNRGKNIRSYNKEALLKYLYNDLKIEKIYDKATGDQLFILIELYLMYNNFINTNGKIWFIDSVGSYINNLIKPIKFKN